MTLRAEISIVPFGSEENRYELYRVECYNQGTIAERGFGHVICSYGVALEKYNNPTEQQLLKAPEWELIKRRDGVIKHNRRDGAVALIAKAAKMVEEWV